MKILLIACFLLPFLLLIPDPPTRFQAPYFHQIGDRILLIDDIGLVEDNSPYLHVLNEDPQLRNELELALGRYYDQKQLQARQR